MQYMMIAGAVLIAIFTAYFFYAQNVIKRQTEKLVAYEITVQTQEKALEKLGVAVETIKVINSELTDIERLAVDNAVNIDEKLDGLRLIEDADELSSTVNKIAEERVRCFALATGAVPEKDEVNTVCPHLLN